MIIATTERILLSGYCDNYAKEESDRWYTAEFCQSVCDNYEDVITKDDPCE